MFCSSTHVASEDWGFFPTQDDSSPTIFAKAGRFCGRDNRGGSG